MASNLYIKYPLLKLVTVTVLSPSTIIIMSYLFTSKKKINQAAKITDTPLIISNYKSYTISFIKARGLSNDYGLSMLRLYSTDVLFNARPEGISSISLWVYIYTYI